MLGKNERVPNAMLPPFFAFFSPRPDLMCSITPSVLLGDVPH